MTWKRINEVVCVPRWRCTSPKCGRVVTSQVAPNCPCDRCGGQGVPIDERAQERARSVLAGWDVEA